LLKKRDHIILFAVGVFTVGLGAWLIGSLIFNLLTGNSAGNYGIAGAVFIFAGAVMIKDTYQIFIPLKTQLHEVSICPYCGALTAEDSSFCEKCKNKLEQDKES
jgi:ribosomal protein L40E